MASLESPDEAVAEKVIDPVCLMQVIPGRTRLATMYQGKGYWFCSEDCLSAFEMNPKKYSGVKRAGRKRWFGRYLEWMARTNKQRTSEPQDLNAFDRENPNLEDSFFRIDGGTVLERGKR